MSTRGSRIVRAVPIVVGALLLSVLAVVPAEGAPSSLVKLAAYRIPDRLLAVSLGKGQGDFGYGYPPAYGFDTADHNVQCYIAPSEDSSPFACGVQKRAWRATGSRCRSPRCVGIEGFANAVYGGGSASVTCDSIPLVPRERRPGSTATEGDQVNRVLPAGSSIKAFGVTCNASGSGRSAAIRCVEGRDGHGFEVSRSHERTF